MKCSKCGREFGNGANCQNCGVDRVTGLGNYSGYDKPSGSYEPQYSSSNNGGYASNTMVCYACSEIIPKNSIYCPACGRQLWVECPNCGATYSSQYKICSKCGTNREVYYKQQEADRQRALREEEERQRKQREWEQSPEGQAEIARREKERRKQENEDDAFYGCWGQIILWGGSIILFFLLDDLIDRNWLNKDIPLFTGLTFRTLILFGISFAGSFACLPIIDKIRKG